MVEKRYNVKLTRDPNARATLSGNSGTVAAMIMAWYCPDLYRRVPSYSGTFVNQQWPPDPDTSHGPWGFHESLIQKSSKKPIRIWMEIGDRDLYNPNAVRDAMHDWVAANKKMASVLAARRYIYLFLFVKNASHWTAR